MKLTQVSMLVVLSVFAFHIEPLASANDSILPPGGVDCFVFQVIEKDGEISIQEPQLPNTRGVANTFQVVTAFKAENVITIKGKQTFDFGRGPVTSDFLLSLRPGIERASVLVRTFANGSPENQALTCR